MGANPSVSIKLKTINCHIKTDFKAPLSFVFSWCTDFSTSDPKLEKEKYARRIIEKTRSRIVFEDLQDMKDGWSWQRATVTLIPPDRWHMDNIGNRRDVTADYVLSRLPRDQTELDLRWKVRPKTAAVAKITKNERERSVEDMWRKFAEVLERDYRRTGGEA